MILKMIPIGQSGLKPRILDKTIVDLQHEFGCIIIRKQADPSLDLPFPYYVVSGESEKNVYLVVIELYKVINYVLGDWVEHVISGSREAVASEIGFYNPPMEIPKINLTSEPSTTLTLTDEVALTAKYSEMGLDDEEVNVLVARKMAKNADPL